LATEAGVPIGERLSRDDTRRRVVQNVGDDVGTDEPLKVDSVFPSRHLYDRGDEPGHVLINRTLRWCPPDIARSQTLKASAAALV
jgi:hypothetical protein